MNKKLNMKKIIKDARAQSHTYHGTLEQVKRLSNLKFKAGQVTSDKKHIISCVAMYDDPNTLSITFEDINPNFLSIKADDESFFIEKDLGLYEVNPLADELYEYIKIKKGIK